jgi:hypothetical protein
MDTHLRVGVAAKLTGVPCVCGVAHVLSESSRWLLPPSDSLAESKLLRS